MLFDERDLRVFDNTDSRNYFREILQSYYSQNYRATIVLLYSFVIYDLFIKLQNMANEGDSKAITKLAEINSMISDDEKYSTVESTVVQFFKDNCPLYFDNFVEDIDYLKNCRNKCAHLKVNDDSLFVPSDYHAKMLICSMYDHILSVKAPFITDLFSIAQVDVERYSETITYIIPNSLRDSIQKAITDKYLGRMTYDALKKSYKTFIRLLFISDSEDCVKNVYGLYAFVFSMTDYSLKNGYTSLFKEDSIVDMFSRINVDTLQNNSARADSLMSLAITYPIVMDIIRDNKEVFEYISQKVLSAPSGLKYYRAFYPREPKSVYDYFKDHRVVQKALFSDILYHIVKESDNFDLAEFALIMIKSIPTYNGFSAADSYMTFLMNHLSELTIDNIQKIMKIYNTNDQCTIRARHSEDISVVQKYIGEHKECQM